MTTAIQSDEMILERARSLCREGCFMVRLQHRRLHSVEAEDQHFIFRWWGDLQLLIVGLRRLRRSAEIAQGVRKHCKSVQSAIKEFDDALPALKKVRNVGEHIDAYALESPNRHNKRIGREQVQVGSWDGTVYCWLGESLNVDISLRAAEKLYESIKSYES